MTTKRQTEQQDANTMRLPEALRPLNDLAHNLWWSWDPAATDMFQSIDRDLWSMAGSLSTANETSRERVNNRWDRVGAMDCPLQWTTAPRHWRPLTVRYLMLVKHFTKTVRLGQNDLSIYTALKNIAEVSAQVTTVGIRLAASRRRARISGSMTV